MTLSILLTFFSSLIALPDTSIHTTVEAQAIVSDAGITPFWMHSLQYGSVPIKNPGIVLRAWNGKGYNLKKKYDWKYEVEATGWTGKQNEFWLTQAYVSGRRGKWELWAGRRKEVYGLGDTTMTAGFYAWSGNALPMPKVQLGTRDYLNFAKGWLGIHMTYSHGWFDNQGEVKNAYLHQKTLYGRIGKPTSIINLYGGLNHQVTWGGERIIKTGGPYDIFPSSLNAYFYVITLLKDRTIVKIDENTSGDDSNNQYGNHLGSIDLAIKLNLKLGTILLYKQTAYETGRVVSLVTANDGIYGLSLNLKRNKFVKRILFESFSTMNQGRDISDFGKLFNVIDPHWSERENYFNSGARNAGYVYFNTEIGTPFIIFDQKGQNGSREFKFLYNYVEAYNISLLGYLPNKVEYLFRFSTSKHNNENRMYLKLADYTLNSYYLKLSKLINKYTISASIAYDQGTRLNNSLAISGSIKYLLY
jgi:hypothetical protein